MEPEPRAEVPKLKLYIPLCAVLVQSRICKTIKDLDPGGSQRYIRTVTPVLFFDASLCSPRCPSGSSWWCSRRAWRSTVRRWRTSWTVSRGCCGGATTASTAPSTLAPTRKTSRPSAQIWPRSSFWTTRPELTELIQVHTFLPLETIA